MSLELSTVIEKFWECLMLFIQFLELHKTWYLWSFWLIYLISNVLKFKSSSLKVFQHFSSCIDRNIFINKKKQKLLSCKVWRMKYLCRLFQSNFSIDLKVFYNTRFLASLCFCYLLAWSARREGLRLGDIMLFKANIIPSATWLENLEE